MAEGTLKLSKHKQMSLMDPCAVGAHTAAKQRINRWINSQHRKKECRNVRNMYHLIYFPNQYCLKYRFLFFVLYRQGFLF